jgi:hypothetical protein
MAGVIKVLIESYVNEMSNGNEGIAKSIYIRLALNGIVHSKYTDESNDNPEIMEKLYRLARQANIKI